MNNFIKILILIVLSLVGCSMNNEPQFDDDILAKIGNKTISVSEFQTRAELIIRPEPYKDKNITLNNLVLEKILSLEAGSQSEALKNPNLQAQIKGIAEQKMREQLFVEVGLKNASIDSNDFNTCFRLSQREYNLSFHSIQKEEIAQKLNQLIEKSPDSLGAVFEQLSENGQIGTKTIKWNDPDPDIIHNSLFTAPVALNSVIGPLRVNENEWIIMRVDNWSDTPILGPENYEMRKIELSKKMMLMQGKNLFRKFTNQLMSGKRIEFNPESFDWIADKVYVNEMQSQHIALSGKSAEQGEIPLRNLQEIDKIMDKPFFTIGNETWTVGDFKLAIMSHPLVYRKQPDSKKSFMQQFRLAIGDLMRDHLLNEEAYKLGLDKSPEVHRTVNMWTDAYNALYQEENIMSKAPEVGASDYEKTKNKMAYWDAYIDSLRMAYANQISLNSTKYNKIKLTKIDLYVRQPQVPFPTPAPGFPQFTLSGDLGYLNKR